VLQANPWKFCLPILGSELFSSLHRKLSNVYCSTAFLPAHPITYISDTARKGRTDYWKFRWNGDDMLGTQTFLLELCIFMYFLFI